MNLLIPNLILTSHGVKIRGVPHQVSSNFNVYIYSEIPSTTITVGRVKSFGNLVYGMIRKMSIIKYIRNFVKIL